MSVSISNMDEALLQAMLSNKLGKNCKLNIEYVPHKQIWQLYSSTLDASVEFNIEDIKQFERMDDVLNKLIKRK